ncbi:MAG: phosphoribosylformylglycinamidine synthase subunit PurS [Microbacteriaceae bacterium]|nr:phosphoribosylformylglycinamidine synthase subunit PurS [Microbacteriaceae bacterium]
MPTIVVEVMPKQELLDPQGKAVAAAIARKGISGVSAVQVGKRFEIITEGPVTAELLESVKALAEDFLSNAVIEDVVSIEVVE